MATDREGTRIKYQPITEEQKENIPQCCTVRDDDSGFWSKFKAWYIFLVYLVACAMLFVSMIVWIDQHDFQTGSPPITFTRNLYQIQVTGLISTSLVIIRSLASVCTVLLTWRIITITLDREGLTLVELVRFNKCRWPILPRAGSKIPWIWSVWLVLVVWPSRFTAPLANSAVAWVPRIKLSSSPLNVSTQLVDGSVDWDFLKYPETCLKTLISAASMAGKDPAYAFNLTDTPLRRYFPLGQDLNQGSTINLTMPYLNVDLQWIDGADETLFQHVGDSQYADIANLNIGNRGNGSVAILRNTTWDWTTAVPDAPEIYSGNKIITVKVNTMDNNRTLPDGSIANKDSPCPAISETLGNLPNVSQHKVQYYNGNTSIWLGTDCFIIANASITAGNRKGQNCTIDPSGRSVYAATCDVRIEKDGVQADWISTLSLDFMSETMKYVVMLDLTTPFMNTSVENYTKGMLKLAHDAAWSSLTAQASVNNESAIAFPAKFVVRATVDRTKLSIWFAFCVSFALSAVLVAIGQSMSSTKTVRNAFLATLTIDLSDVAHSPGAEGLCDAVKLSKEDSKLPPMVFANDHSNQEHHKCRRRLVFAKDGADSHGRPSEV